MRAQLLLSTLRNLPHWDDEDERKKFWTALQKQAYGESAVEDDDEERPNFASLHALKHMTGGGGHG